MILLTSNNYDDQLDDHSSRKRNYDSFASPSMGKLSIQTENRLPLSSQQKKINKDKDTFSVPVFQPLQVIKNRKEKCKVSQYAGYSLRGYCKSIYFCIN